MNNPNNVLSEEIRKYLTSSLIFTCQNCMIYKYEGSENFYEHKETSNKIYDYITETLCNLTEIFKYDEDKKVTISEQILENKLEYSNIIFDYYLNYFNLEFIKKVYYASKYVNELELSLKTKIIEINNHIRKNSTNIYVDYMPYLLGKLEHSEFHKLASTISHEFDRFTYDELENIFSYDRVYFTPKRLEKIYSGYQNEKFALSTIFQDDVVKAPESSEKIEKVISETQREVMDVISDLTLLYECLNDLNILITFVTDEAILFENQLAVKDIYFTFKSTINDDENLFIEQLFELLDNTIEKITEDDTERASSLLKVINSEKEFDKDTEKLIYILNILKTVYSEDIFDYFVSEFFFEHLKTN